jgi:hypothetical protein
MSVKKFCLHFLCFPRERFPWEQHKHQIHHFLHKQKSKFSAIIQELTADQIKVLAHQTPFVLAFRKADRL